MIKLMEYFHTDWAAMTTNDWQGVIFTLLAVVAMVVVYVLVFNPKNKDIFNAQADMALRDEEQINLGENK